MVDRDGARQEGIFELCGGTGKVLKSFDEAKRSQTKAALQY